MIEEYETELTRFKAHYEEMMERQEKIFALGPIDPERHLFLKENAEIVLVSLSSEIKKPEPMRSMLLRITPGSISKNSLTLFF